MTEEEARRESRATRREEEARERRRAAKAKASRETPASKAGQYDPKRGGYHTINAFGDAWREERRTAKEMRRIWG